jgi:cyanophycinase
MSPKGKLLAIGGAEDKGADQERGDVHRNNLNFFELGILKKIVEEAGGRDARIEVVTTASMIPYEVGNNYLDAFGKSGSTNVGLMHIRNREDALEEQYQQRIREANCVLFSGGNQMRLSTIFGGTKLLDLIRERYQHSDFLIAGTSAGAMAMSKTMIYEGNATRAHLKGEVKITTGLGFMDNVIFDSHFEKRGRFARLAQAVAGNPSSIGIGLGEDTGMLVTQGNQMEAVGSGLVIIIDGHDIRHTNIADIPQGNPISIEHLIVHFCEHGNAYRVRERKFLMKLGDEKELKA